MSPARALERPPVAARTALTTPALIRLGLYAVLAADLLFTIAGVAGVREHRRALQTIGRDSAPSIIAAQHIRAALADMDADAADNLLLKGGSAEALQAFERRRAEAVDALIAAAENITYGDAERVPIRKLAVGLGTYSARIQQALDDQKVNDSRALDAYRAAAKVMDADLLPAALDLDKANLDVLNATYSRQVRQSSVALAFLILATILTVGILLAIQIMLFARTRRILNPVLILATLIALIAASYTVNAFRAADQDLKVAKQDAFDSIHSLWQARSLAYSANADESRYLLDPNPDPRSTTAFQAKAASVANDFLAAELRNITFEGEGPQAQLTLDRFNAYRRIETEIRRLAEHGQRPAAIALFVGRGPTQSGGAFQAFDDALGRTLAINQQEFDRAVTRGFQAMGGLEVTAPLLALLVLALAFLGVLPRLREYWT